MYFNRDYSKFGWLQLPSAMRQPLLGAIVSIITAELQVPHGRLVQFRKDVQYKLRHNSQKCYLQAVCNDALDPIERRIEIFPTESTSEVVPLMYDAVFVAPILLNDASFDDPLIVYNQEFYNSGDYAFQVVVPFDITDDQKIRLIGELEFYKLPSKRYIITKEKI